VGKETVAAPGPRPAGKVRNVALVGHAAAGKTTLAEALLVATGALPRAGRVEDGTTCLDSEEVEVRQQRSVSLGVATVEHAGHRITLLDTPGSPDFVGELRAGLRAADAALFVVSAVGGVDATTVQLWEECAAVGMPRAVVVTQLDRPRADVDDAVRSCRTMLGDGVLPLHLLQRGPDGAVTGLVSLLEPHPDAELGGAGEQDAEQLRAELIEGIIGESEDETLMDRYLGGEELSVADLVADLETAVARGHFHPILCVSPLTGVGVAELLDLLVSAFPCPMEHGCPPVTRPDGSPASSLSCDPDGPLVAEVIKTTTDPYLGRVSLVRVFSGTLRPDTPVHVSGHGLADRGHPDHDADERIGAISCPLGATLRPVAACPAGDICAVARLTSAETGDTLSSPDDPRLVPPWDLPTPQLPVAVEAASRATRTGWPRRCPGWSPRTRPSAWNGVPTPGSCCCGASATRTPRCCWNGCAPGTASRSPLCRCGCPWWRPSPGRCGSPAGTSSSPVGTASTPSSSVEAEPGRPARHRLRAAHRRRHRAQPVPRQRGEGHPGPGRARDRRRPADRRSARDPRRRQGALGGLLRRRLPGRRALALREAAAAAGTRVLEPWCEVQVVVPGEYVGAVMSDLSGRRARVTGSDADPERDRTTVRAEVPEVELLGYAGALRSVSHGTGSFSRRPLGHEPAPASLTAVPA
jgi:elongation factor G